MKIEFEVPFSKKKSALVESLIRFSLDHMVNKAVYSHATISVVFQRNLLKTDDLIAGMDKDSANCYTIYIDPSVSIPQMLMAVAHEVVHIKQYLLGECVIPSEMKPRADHEAYWDDELEIEAYGREFGLYRMWLQASGNSKKSWV